MKAFRRSLYLLFFGVITTGILLPARVGHISEIEKLNSLSSAKNQEQLAQALASIEFNENWTSAWDKKSKDHFLQTCFEQGYQQTFKLLSERFKNENFKPELMLAIRDLCKSSVTPLREQLLEAQIQEWLPALDVGMISQDLPVKNNSRKIQDWIESTALVEWKDDKAAMTKIKKSAEYYLNERPVQDQNTERMPASRKLEKR